MILILGSSGYIGDALFGEINGRGDAAYAIHPHPTSWRQIAESINRNRATLVANCAAFIPKSSVSLCDQHKAETIMGNVAFVQMVTDACEATGTPLMHLSTGCLFDEQREYTEDDKPTRGFDGHCGMYVGCKLLAEDIVRRYERHYILRLRLPFDEFDNPRNYLSKLVHYTKTEGQINDHINSLSHRGDFCKAALDLWKLRAEFGTYHVANPGQIAAGRLLEQMYRNMVMESGPFPVLKSQSGTTGCRLSVKKLLSTGVKIRDVNEAVDDAIKNWVPNV